MVTVPSPCSLCTEAALAPYDFCTEAAETAQQLKNFHTISVEKWHDAYYTLLEAVCHFHSVVLNVGSLVTTAHAHQCCIFQLCEACAFANETDYEIDYA